MLEEGHPEQHFPGGTVRIYRRGNPGQIYTADFDAVQRCGVGRDESVSGLNDPGRPPFEAKPESNLLGYGYQRRTGIQKKFDSFAIDFPARNVVTEPVPFEHDTFFTSRANAGLHIGIRIPLSVEQAGKQPCQYQCSKDP